MVDSEWTHSSVQYLKMYYVGIDVAPGLEDVYITTFTLTESNYIVNYFVIQFAKGEPWNRVMYALTNPLMFLTVGVNYTRSDIVY